MIRYQTIQVRVSPNELKEILEFKKYWEELNNEDNKALSTFIRDYLLLVNKARKEF